MQSGFIAPSASLPRPSRPPSTLCGSSTIRIGPRGLDQVDGLLAAGLLAVLVEVVDVLLVDGADRHHHDLDVRAGGEVAHLAELGGVVEEVLEGGVGVEGAEVLLGDLERLVDALLDGHRRHDDDELGEAVAPVQLEDRAQVDVGLARAGLHLHGEIAGGQRGGRRQAVAELDVVQVGQEFVIQQGAGGCRCRGRSRQPPWPCCGPKSFGDGELGAADFLPAEEVADRSMAELVVEVGLEVQFHGRTPLQACESCSREAESEGGVLLRCV